MLTLFIVLAVLTFVFWLAFKFTGALLAVLIWLCIKLPIALALFAVGLALCVTVLLIPVGLVLLRTSFRVLLPA